MVILRGGLNNNHKIGRYAVVRAALLDNGELITYWGADIGRLNLLLGQGGGGKYHTTNAIITKIIREHGFAEGNYSLCNITRKSATVINGSTVHSFKEVFSLPLGRTGNVYK